MLNKEQLKKLVKATGAALAVVALIVTYMMSCNKAVEAELEHINIDGETLTNDTVIYVDQ